MGVRDQRRVSDVLNEFFSVHVVGKEGHGVDSHGRTVPHGPLHLELLLAWASWVEIFLFLGGALRFGGLEKTAQFFEDRGHVVTVAAVGLFKIFLSES